MDISRNKFSNVICIIFSLLIVSMFCVWNNIKLGLNNMVSSAIIAAVICGLIACSIFFLNRLVNKVSQGKSYNENLIFNILIGVVSLIFVVIRLLIISNVISAPMKLGSIYDMAMIGEDGKAFINFSSIEGIVASVISLFLRFMGNTYFPIIIVQFIFSVISFVLLLFGVKQLLGKAAAIGVCLGVAVLPMFFGNIASDGIENLVMLEFSLIVFLTARYKKSMDEYAIKPVFSVLIGLVLGLFALYHRVFLFAFVIPIVVLWDCNSEATKTKSVNTFLMLIASLFSFWIPLVLESFVFAGGGVDGFIDEAVKVLSVRFSINYSIASIERFVMTPYVLLIILLCITYCVLFWKNTDDAGHIMATFSVLLFVQMAFTDVGYQNVYTMLATLSLLAIAGYSFCNFGYDPNASGVYKMEDDMQPAVVQTIGNKVVASDEEIQQIFAENEEKEKLTFSMSDISSSASENKSEVKAEEKEIVEEKTTASYSDDFSDKKDGVAEVVGGSIDTGADNVETKDYASADASVDEVYSATSDNDSVTINVAESELTNETESKYNEPEERKTSDFGMKDADFASLFSGSAIPPKFARGDMYDTWDDYTVEEKEENDEASVDEGIKSDDLDLSPAHEVETLTDSEAGDEAIEDDSKPDADENEESKDKKAYVDTFFSYLYDESIFEQPIEVPEPKEEPEEVYVSNASKFDDLDIDLGVDAFDYVPPKEEIEDVVSTEETIEKNMDASDENGVYENANTDEYESVQDDIKTEDFQDEVTNAGFVADEGDTVGGETYVANADEADITYSASGDSDSIEVDAVKDADTNTETDDVATKEEHFTLFDSENSTEEVINIDEQFDFDEVIKKPGNSEDTVETAWDNIDTSDDASAVNGSATSVEDEIFKALSEFDMPKAEEMSVEEAIERRIREEEFSYEEAINRRLEQEKEEADKGFSFEEALERKLNVEDSIRDAEARLNVSYEEILSDKIALEESLDFADSASDMSVEEVLAKKFEIEDALEDSGADDGFSIQEAIEQKIDVEQDIDEAINKPLMDALDEAESFIEEFKLINSSLDDSVDSIVEGSVEETAETLEMVTDSFSFEEVPETIDESFVFEETTEPAEEVVDSFSFEETTEPVEEVVDSFSFEETAEPVEEVVDSFSFEETAKPVEETVDSFCFEETAEPVEETVDSFSFEETVEPVEEVVDSFSFEETTEPVEEVVDSFSFEETTEPVEEVVDSFSFEEITEPVEEVVDSFSFEETAEPVEETADSFGFEETTGQAEEVVDSFSFEETAEPVEETVDSFGFEETTGQAEEVVDSFGFEETTEPVEEVVDSFSFEETTEPIEETVDGFSFGESAALEENITDFPRTEGEMETAQTTENVSFDGFSETENVKETKDADLDAFDYSETDRLAAEALAQLQSEEPLSVLEDDSESLEAKALAELAGDDFEDGVVLTEEVFAQAAEEPKKVELIENPLPLPKKHVHRELDYGRSVPESWMHYDVEIDSKNNFFDI